MTRMTPIINNEDAYDRYDDVAMTRRSLDVFLHGLVALLEETDIRYRPCYSLEVINSLIKIISGEDASKALGLIRENHRPSKEERDRQIAFDYIAAQAKKEVAGKVIKIDLANEWAVKVSTVDQAIKKYREMAKKKFQMYKKLEKRLGEETISGLIQYQRQLVLSRYTGKKE